MEVSSDRFPQQKTNFLSMPGDFPLLDRRVFDELQQFEDHQPYLRGTIAALVFDQDRRSVSSN